jgi:hypothetical protein
VSTTVCWDAVVQTPSIRILLDYILGNPLCEKRTPPDVFRIERHSDNTGRGNSLSSYTQIVNACTDQRWRALSGNSFLLIPAFVIAVCAASLMVPGPLFAESGVLQASPLQFELHGLTRSPAAAMTSGSLAGWNEDDWVPFRLTITNKDPSDHVADVAIDLDHQNAGRYGVDAFAACFSESAADCGSGMTPAVGSSALGSGSLWKLLVDSSEQVPQVSYESMMGGVTVIRWRLSSLSVPADSSLYVKWAIHLAKSDSTNLACAEGSPLAACSPQTVPAGMGEASWPGRSLQVRLSLPIPDERTVSIDVTQQPTQQMTMTSTVGTATAVVVIPGFPMESIILGIVLGLMVLGLVHLQRNPMGKRIGPE